MLRPIKQHVVLPAPAAELFAAYLNPETHAAITGAPVIIGRNPGDRFEAFNGQLSGHMIDVVEPRLIVQAWRSAIFYDTNPDSTLVLAFSDTEEGGRIDLIHTGVPEHDHDGVTDGWPKFYWEPWRRYLENTK